LTHTPPTTRTGNGPPPAAAATLYGGTVMHARLRPAHHRFSYRVFTVCLDLDRLDEAGRASRLFSIDRVNLVSVHQRDHGPRDGTPLAPYARRLAAQALKGPDTAVTRVLMLAYPRILGQVFNPLTVYFAYTDGPDPAVVLYEVRNTFGGMHTYVRPVAPGELSDGGVRQREHKDFFVSPFIPMDKTYHFRLMPPGEAVRVRILETDGDGPLLSATYHGMAEALTTRRILSALRSGRLFPFKVIGAIHVEAIRLLLKNVKGLPIPKTAKGTTVSANGRDKAQPGTGTATSREKTDFEEA